MEKAGDLLIDSIADAVAERLSRLGLCTKRLLSLEEAALFMGWSQDTMRDMVNQGRIVPLRPTRRLQFDLLDLYKFIDDEKRKI